MSRFWDMGLQDDRMGKAIGRAFYGVRFLCFTVWIRIGRPHGAQGFASHYTFGKMLHEKEEV